VENSGIYYTIFRNTPKKNCVHEGVRFLKIANNEYKIVKKRREMLDSR